jgi:hypothetical protein
MLDEVIENGIIYTAKVASSETVFHNLRRGKVVQGTVSMETADT